MFKILGLVALILVVLGTAALFWWDVFLPRKQHKIARRERRRARRLGNIRVRTFSHYWALRKARKLTDQRSLKAVKDD